MAEIKIQPAANCIGQLIAKLQKACISLSCPIQSILKVSGLHNTLKISYFVKKIIKNCEIMYLSMPIQTKIKLDKNTPKIRKNAIILHILSPASQETVAAHPISKGIVRNVTYWEISSVFSFFIYRKERY